MNVSIVIPNYNGVLLLKQHLPEVVTAVAWYCKKFSAEGEIIVVDDGSDDNSVEFLNEYANKEKKVSIVVEKESENSGFASTVNKGVSVSRNEIIILLNTDVVPQRDFLESLINHFEDEEVFGVGMLDISKEKSGEVLRGRGIGQWKRGFLIHARGDTNKKTTLWVSGGSGAFRKSLWQRLGGMFEIYNPFYWEDIDLSYRARKAGYKTHFEPKSIAIHEHDEGSIKTQYSDYDVKVIAYRNQFFFVWVNLSDRYLWILHVLWMPYHVVKALFAFDSAFIFGFCRAIFEIPSIVKARLKAQSLVIVSDRETMREFLK